MKSKDSRKPVWLIAAIILLIVVITVIAIRNHSEQPAAVIAAEPTAEPTVEPTPEPTAEPTAEPTPEPTAEPTAEPTPEPTAEPTPEPTAEPTPEPTAEPVRIETQNYEFIFNGQMAEKIFYREIEGTEADDREFCIRLNDQEYVIFTLTFNSLEGDIVHMIADAAGNKIPVAFVMNALPEGLTDEAANEFCLYQEAVNEVVESIKVN